MSEYFQNFNHYIKRYIECTIQNSQTYEQFCCLLYKAWTLVFSCIQNLHLQAPCHLAGPYPWMPCSWCPSMISFLLFFQHLHIIYLPLYIFLFSFFFTAALPGTGTAIFLILSNSRTSEFIVVYVIVGDGIVVLDDSRIRCTSWCAQEQEETGWSNSTGQNQT